MSNSLRILAVLLLVAPAALSGQLYYVQTFPVGRMPQGIALAEGAASTPSFVAVANAGDNTVTILQVGSGGLSTVKTQQVASPFDVVACGGFLVTSSSGTVTLLKVDGTILNTFAVGTGAYGGSCFTIPGSGSGKAVVSSSGDNALYLLDLVAGTVTGKIPNVPGSANASGVSVYVPANSASPLAFVASGNTNVVTVVNLVQGKVVATLSVPQPIVLQTVATGINIVSANDSLYFIDPNTLAVSSEGSAGSVSPVSAATTVGTDTFVVSAGAIVDAVQTSGGSSAYFPVAGVVGVAEVVPLCHSGQCSSVAATVPSANTVVVITPLTGPNTPGVAIANAAGFDNWRPAGDRPLSRGAVGGALATAFTPSQPNVPTLTASSLPLPTTLGGVSINVGGSAMYANSAWTYSSAGAMAAPLLYVSPTQLNFQMPIGIQGELVPVQIVYPNGTMLLTSVRAGSVDPGVFTLTSVPMGPGAVLNQDNSVNLPSNPATRGSVIQIFATGAGATSPALATGSPAPAGGSPLVMTIVQPTVTVAGIQAKVLFSGMAPGFVGLWQINAMVPQSIAPGTVSLIVTANDTPSNTVTIAVQ